MSSEDGSPHTQLEIGGMLRRARAERGLSLWQAEDATKIRARYLHDLERENFDVLPAVYVLGSLKTYADYLGLDGEALSRELRRRQAPPQEEQDGADEEPKNGERGRSLASLAGLVGSDAPERDEDGAPAAVTAYGPRLLLGLGAVLVLVLAVALASILGGGGRPAISQVREPEVSDAPSRIASASEVGSGRKAERDVAEDARPERQAKAPDEGGEEERKDEGDRASKSEEDRDLAGAAQDVDDREITPPTPSPASASITSASTASASTASASTASASTASASTASASAASANASASAIIATSAPAATAPASVIAAAPSAAPDPPARATPASGTAQQRGPAPPPAAEPAPSVVRPAPAARAAPGGSGYRRVEVRGVGGTEPDVRVLRRVRIVTDPPR